MSTRLSRLMGFLIPVLAAVPFLAAGATAPTTAPAKASTDVVRVALALPPGFVGEAKTMGAGWAGGWTSPEGVNLLVSLEPRPAPGPLALERAVKAAVPMLISKAASGMKISDTPIKATFAGHPFIGHRLTGMGKSGPEAGIAGLADIGTATISLVAYGPQKAFDAAWPNISAAMNKMKITQPAALGPTSKPATRPAVASGSAGTPTAPGKPFEFGHFTFTPPPGWTVKQDAKRVILTPPGGVAGNPVAMVTLLTPVSSKGAKLIDWLATFTEAVHKDVTVRQKKEPKPAEGPGGAGVVTQVFVIQAKGATRVEYRVYAALAAGDEVQSILYASPEAADFQKHLRGIL